jgi:hypothetical protein
MQVPYIDCSQFLESSPVPRNRATSSPKSAFISTSSFIAPAVTPCDENTTMLNQVLKDLRKEATWQGETEEMHLKPWLNYEKFLDTYTDAMQAVLTLALIYGVEPGTACLFQQQFAKYLRKRILRPYMAERTGMCQIGRAEAVASANPQRGPIQHSGASNDLSPLFRQQPTPNDAVYYLSPVPFDWDASEQIDRGNFTECIGEPTIVVPAGSNE